MPEKNSLVEGLGFGVASSRPNAEWADAFRGSHFADAEKPPRALSSAKDRAYFSTRIRRSLYALHTQGLENLGHPCSTADARNVAPPKTLLRVVHYLKYLMS